MPSEPAASPSAMQSDNLRGASIMVASMALFVASDACLKALAGHATLFEVAFWRGIGVTAAFAGWAALSGAFAAPIGRADWGWILARGAVEALVAWLFITALFTLPLANATAILQATPLLMTAAGAVLLGERVGARRWGAVLIGLAGVMIIVRPGLAGFDANSLWALGAVVGVALRDLTTRRIGRAVPMGAVVTVTSACVTLFGALFGGWRMPAMEAASWWALAGSGVFIALAYVAAVGAMRFGDASFTAPFRYAGVIWAGIAGFAFFGEVPDGPTALGAAVVVGAGLYALGRARGAPSGPARAPLKRRGGGP